MHRRSFYCLLVLLACALPLLAADFWQTKKYTEWTDKEMKKLLSDSPWAVTITTGSGIANTMPNPPGGGGGGGRGGGGGGGGGDMGGGGGGDMGGGGGGGGMGGGGGAGGMGGGGGRGGGGAAMSMHLVWGTALPIKQALIKGKLGEKADSPEAEKALAAPDLYYVLMLDGVRARGGLTPEALKSATKLNRKGKPPLVPEKVSVPPPQQGTPQSVLFYFPKQDAIVLEDKEVEFVTKIGQTDVKHKFKLKDMMFGGSLSI